MKKLILFTNIIFNFFVITAQTAPEFQLNRVKKLSDIAAEYIINFDQISFNNIADAFGHLYGINESIDIVLLRAYSKKRPADGTHALIQTIKSDIENKQKNVPDKLIDHLKNFFLRIETSGPEKNQQELFEIGYDIPLLDLWKSGAIARICCGPLMPQSHPGNQNWRKLIWVHNSVPITQLFTHYLKYYSAEKVSLLLQPAPNNSLPSPDDIPIFRAVQAEREKLTSVLIAYGADTEMISSARTTFLHEMCKRELENDKKIPVLSLFPDFLEAILKMLKKKLGEARYRELIELRDANGKTAYDYASECRNGVALCALFGKDGVYNTSKTVAASRSRIPARSRQTTEK